MPEHYGRLTADGYSLTEGVGLPQQGDCHLNEGNALFWCVVSYQVQGAARRRSAAGDNEQGRKWAPP